MSELKTLKDFRENEKTLAVFKNETIIEDYKVSMKNLREEAVKWVKFINNPSEDFVGFAASDSKKGEMVEIDIVGWETAFKLFFNLTEEDLK